LAGESKVSSNAVGRFDKNPRVVSSWTVGKYFSPHFLSGTHQRAWIPPVSLLIRANLRTSLQSHIVPVTSVAAGIRSNTGESKFQIAFAVCFADQRPVTVAQRFKNVFKKDQRL